MCKISIIDNNGTKQVCEASKGAMLKEILQSFVPMFSFPCAGNHTCGKCKVYVNGGVKPPDETELQLLTEDEAANGMRLACFCSIIGDAEVTIGERKGGKTDIIAWCDMPDFACTEDGFGLAVDIGTTTVAMQLIERKTGKILAQCLEENAQRCFGADVISRIGACQEKGVEVLSDLICRQLDGMAEKCMKKADIDSISESVVTGNATMLHIYEGLDPASIAVAPFDVQSFFGRMSCCSLADAPVYLPRCIGAYVGADIICSVMAADMVSGGTQLLADIGTNGEMVLVHDKKILCCATAAGPAFEGTGLSCGMPAAPGAVSKIWLQDGNLHYKTIQDKKAIGICGSGILDALAVMLKSECMDESGYIEDVFTIDEGHVELTQKDVRQIQLAKSAVCAGVMTLLEECGLDSPDIDCFSIAGGLGSSIDLSSAAQIGLFPASLSGKARFIGNGALGGATMLLLNRELRSKSEQIAKNASEISLSSSALFRDYYIDCMAFEEF